MEKIILFLFGCFVAGAISPTEDQIAKELTELTIETAMLEPAQIDNLSLWVPAVKSGPFVNRSCQAQQNLTDLSELPAAIDHQKEKNCPPQPARILAEQASDYHEKTLPLAIFNGWQWEYSFTLSQYEQSSYSLPQRGGSWENCLEAILNMTTGEITLTSFKISPNRLKLLEQSQAKSTIYIKTFSAMRTRDGYPKERKL